MSLFNVVNQVHANHQRILSRSCNQPFNRFIFKSFIPNAHQNLKSDAKEFGGMEKKELNCQKVPDHRNPKYKMT